MNNNQLHGKTFEDLIKAFVFRGAADQARPSIALFDIEGRFDRDFGLPTSIKATGDQIISLADARRFWQLNEPFRMLVGRYRQEAAYKVFHRIDEFRIERVALNMMRGDISLQEISDIHEGLSLESFPLGGEEAARNWAKQAVASGNQRSGLIVLNPKIDTKGQRRLQCSVRADALGNFSLERPDLITHRVFTQQIGGMPLPQSIISGRRKFRER